MMFVDDASLQLTAFRRGALDGTLDELDLLELDRPSLRTASQQESNCAHFPTQPTALLREISDAWANL